MIGKIVKKQNGLLAFGLVIIASLMNACAISNDSIHDEVFGLAGAGMYRIGKVVEEYKEPPNLGIGGVLGIDYFQGGESYGRTHVSGEFFYSDIINRDNAEKGGNVYKTFSGASIVMGFCNRDSLFFCLDFAGVSAQLKYRQRSNGSCGANLFLS